MSVLLRTLQTLLLILAIVLGAWARPADVALDEDSEPTVSEEVAGSASLSDGDAEDNTSGETNDSDGEDAKEANLLGINTVGFEMSQLGLECAHCLNEELPLRGRETTRELFRPPQA